MKGTWTFCLPKPLSALLCTFPSYKSPQSSEARVCSFPFLFPLEDCSRAGKRLLGYVGIKLNITRKNKGTPDGDGGGEAGVDTTSVLRLHMGSNNLGEKREEEEEKVGAASSVSVHACFMESNHFVCRTAVNIPHKDSLSRPFSSLVFGTIATGQKKKTNTGETDRHQKKIFILPPFPNYGRQRGCVYKEGRRETNAEFCREEEGDCCTQKESFPRLGQMIARSLPAL